MDKPKTRALLRQGNSVQAKDTGSFETIQRLDKPETYALLTQDSELTNQTQALLRQDKEWTNQRNRHYWDKTRNGQTRETPVLRLDTDNG